MTLDQGFAHQHNPGRLAFGIVIVSVVRNRPEHFLPLLSESLTVIERIRPGQVVYVPASRRLPAPR